MEFIRRGSHPSQSHWVAPWLLCAAQPGVVRAPVEPRALSESEDGGAILHSREANVVGGYYGRKRAAVSMVVVPRGGWYSLVHFYLLMSDDKAGGRRGPAFCCWCSRHLFKDFIPHQGPIFCKSATTFLYYRWVSIIKTNPASHSCRHLTTIAAAQNCQGRRK